MEINKAIFDTFPILETDRLIMREIRASDADKIFKMRSNGRINQFIARNEMGKFEKSIELVERTISAYNNGQGIGWAGVLRGKDEIIGTCGFNQIDYQNLRAEIGGELSIDYWGRKIALEAVRAIVQFGFEQMNLHAIEAKVSPMNRGAVFILNTLEFKKEAHFKDRIFFNGQFSDMAVYTLIR
jgi:ribosomal-protein-alanine N-acetyltransferase